MAQKIRKCLQCGYTGEMSTYLSDNWGGIIIAIVLLCFWVVPGLVFIGFFWGKWQCPNCGSIGKNSDPILGQQIDLEGTRICPHCAESIKAAAKLCRYCQKSVNPL